MIFIVLAICRYFKLRKEGQQPSQKEQREHISCPFHLSDCSCVLARVFGQGNLKQEQFIECLRLFLVFASPPFSAKEEACQLWSSEEKVGVVLARL